MLPEYVPILKTKKGEIDALSKLDTIKANRILPVFELPAFSRSIREAKRFQHQVSPTAAYLNELAEMISSVRRKKRCFVDIRAWAPNTTIENGEHIINYTYNRLAHLEVKVDPIINYDFWDDPEYRQAFLSLTLSNDSMLCIRLESDALEDMDDPAYFLDRLEDIIYSVGVAVEKCSVLIDFRDVTRSSVVDIQESVEKVLEVLARLSISYVVMAGCSLSPNVANSVAEINSSGIVLRKEMIAWKAIKGAKPGLRLVFGDYGIRNPNVEEDIIAPHANGKIRYTISNKYFVIRGHSIQYFDKGKQCHRLAKELVESPHYMEENFSWGDEYIKKCSNFEVGPGNSTTWISVDTNHHITSVVNEVVEFLLHVSSISTFSESST